MPDNRLITVAIHTYHRAVALKEMLGANGITAVLQNVNLESPEVSPGVRVRIAETDLPAALCVIENVEIQVPVQQYGESVDGLTVLVPVDFSPHSHKATRLAFDIASRHKASVRIIHAYSLPLAGESLQLTNSLTLETPASESGNNIANEAKSRMTSYAAELNELIRQRQLPPIQFSTAIHEGVPEDCIYNEVKRLKPWLIVMGTRGAGKKEKDQVGSVTAEVLDTCRLQALTVPENCNLDSIFQARHIVVFANLEQEDILALDTLNRLLPNINASRNIRITIACIPGKKFSVIGSSEQAQHNLMTYYTEHYPGFTFDIVRFHLDNLVEEYERLSRQHSIDMLVVANKKRNIFARIFNPALPHRLLFHFDIPMIVIPV